jgi:hypothetical protein
MIDKALGDFMNADTEVSRLISTRPVQPCECFDDETGGTACGIMSEDACYPCSERGKFILALSRAKRNRYNALRRLRTAWKKEIKQ